MANFVQPGKTIQVVATGDIAYHGVVVVGDMIAVASHSAKKDDVISCDAEGVFAFDKKEAEAIGQGKKAYLGTDGKITATVGTNTYAGKVWKAALADDTTILVKINA